MNNYTVCFPTACYISPDQYTYEEAEKQLQTYTPTPAPFRSPYVIHVFNNVLITIKLKLKAKHRVANKLLHILIPSLHDCYFMLLPFMIYYKCIL